MSFARCPSFDRSLSVLYHARHRPNRSSRRLLILRLSVSLHHSSLLIVAVLLDRMKLGASYGELDHNGMMPANES
ncbi:hypothetical protein IQ07DRAFT_583381 [Pyrenochaeta sp. DS3sAY3a]|nr:hypothetical protein IQ07DRAFT_583381 [Pyrenochaeta sp. DS3sAY3a]